MALKFQNLRLRNKLLFTIIPIVTLSILTISIYFNKTASKNILNQQNVTMEQMIKQSKEALDSWILERTNFIKALTDNSTFISACEGDSLSQAFSLLVKYHKTLPMYENFFLAHPDGQVFLIAQGDAAGINISAIDTYKINAEKAQQGLIWIGDAGKSPVSGRPVSLITAPVMKNGKVIGIMGTPVELNVFSESFISNVKIGKSGYLYMLDSEGIPLAHPNKKYIMNPEISKYDFTQAIIKQKEGKLIYKWEGKKKIAHFTQQPEKGWIIVATVLQDEYLAPIHRMQILAFILAVSSIVLITLVTWLISSMVSKVISKIVNELKEISQGKGDLTKRISVDSEDETGQLAKWFNTFIDKLHEIISQVKQNAEEVASATNEITATSMQMAAGAEEQSNQVNEVATSVQEMSAAIVESSQNAMQTSDLSQNTVQKAADGLKNMNDTKRDMEEIVVSSSKTNELVKSLSNRTDQIGEIIQVINDIADQTNLLALNAAIEAARAGEQGRGFAVVADEVRKLAERTTKATKEIGNTIQVIQNDTVEAARSMEEATDIIHKGTDSISQTSIVLDDIVQGVNTSMDMIQQIATATEQQSAGAEEISKNIHSISSVATQSASAAEELASTTAQLNRQTERLQALVSEFQL